jgi:regulator of protease activity HflC (stomatin/prohibitin superfamily)
MHQQVSAERTKRAQILESEGKINKLYHIYVTTSTNKQLLSGARQAAINVAEGQKQSKILASEGQKAENINQATGEAQAIVLRAEASAKGLETIAKAIGQDQGSDAVSMSIAEKYVNAFGQMAKESTTLIVPATANDAASLVTQVIISRGDYFFEE